MRRYYSPMLLIVLILGYLPAHAQSGISDDRFARLARGVNLSGWFWYGPETLDDVEQVYTESDFVQLRDLGFTYVRVPIDLGFLLDENDPDLLKDDALAVVDRSLQALRAHDLAVIVDLHSTDQTYYENIFSGRLEDEPAFIETLDAFWASFAQHLSSTDPEWVFLEILNEPVYEDHTADWQPIQQRLAATIRANAPEHTIIATGAMWSSLDTFVDLEPLDDPNVIYNFHFYEPFIFTHQGADWAGDPISQIRDIPYPSSPDALEPIAQQLEQEIPADSPYSWAGSWAREYGSEQWDIHKIDERIQLAVAWSESHGGLRLMCNEFGVYTRFAAPADRVQWLSDVRTTLEKYHISWAMWDYRGIYNGFGIVEPRDGGGASTDGDVATALGLVGVTTVNGLPPDSNWTLFFRDDFDGDTLDTSAWNTCYFWTAPGEGCTNEGNNELEWYVPDQVIVSDGVLHLRGDRRSVNGFEYVSGMISSHQKIAFQYGYAEMRARIPAGQGMWPAFWMMPDTGDWPPEIDVMEIIGSEIDRVYTTYHRMENDQLISLGSWWTGGDYSLDYHTYGVLWQPDRLVWYIDGVERYRTSDHVPAEPMYLIANLAVGGNWPGAPDNTTVFPADLEIDYIAVWQAH